MIEHMFAPAQGSLFGTSSPEVDESFSAVSRRWLDGDAWVDYAPGWLQGDESLFELVAARAEWSSPVVRMYDRMVQTPRLNAPVDCDWDTRIGQMVELLSDRYGVRLDRVSAGYYRDGNDSVAWHGDRIARELPEATVATVSLAGPRRFLLRPKRGGNSISWSLGHGDLIVMGGSCQRTWEHTVPKVASARPRIALMFRHEYDDPAPARPGP